VTSSWTFIHIVNDARNHEPKKTILLCSLCSFTHPNVYFFVLFSLALQPSAGYGLLWLCSPARAMASCGSAAQRGLWPPVALKPSAVYGLLWLCSPARAMACCGSAAQRGLWPAVALQPSAGYGLLWLCSPARAMASSFTRFLDHTQRRAAVCRTPLDE
jgi:hypothetical protein